MVTLIVREFTVDAPVRAAWDHLARLEQWPSWARHITRIDLKPPGQLGPQSAGVIHLAHGIKSTFQMTEFRPYENWKWVGPFLWLTVHYDHKFIPLGAKQTKLDGFWQRKGSVPGFSGGCLRRSIARTWRRPFRCWLVRWLRKLGFKDRLARSASDDRKQST
jgi:polyketide cyclase/dehydrase/lipid transport protein